MTPIRNDEYVRRLPFTETGLRDATDSIEYFVEHSIRFLLDMRDFRNGKQLLETAGLPFLVGVKEPHVRFRLSAAVEDQQTVDEQGHGRHGARRDSQLISWVGSLEPQNNLYKTFSGMEDPPPHGVRPKLSWI